MVSLIKKGWHTIYNRCRRIMKRLELKIFYRLNILDPIKTIDYIYENRCSIARYGDGEFNIMLKEGGVGFQFASNDLSDRLLQVFEKQNSQLLVCIPWSFNHLRYRTKNSKNFWINWSITNERQKRVVKKLRKHAKYNFFGDAQITRPYIAMKNKKRAKRIFLCLKKLWNERDLLIVEGETTRMGVGNDLFINAKSINRILVPATNAFEYCEMILKTVCRYHTKDQLVILAIGPTATILAADLSECGIQALDIGHIDLEYEWFLRNVNQRIALQGKYTNEVPCGDVVTECDDSLYLSQIIHKIGCKKETEA